MRLRTLAAVVILPVLALADDHAHPSAGPTPAQAIDALKEGHARFAAGTPQHPRQTGDRVKELASGQKPFAAILGCSDSRVPPEIVFDQGLGDLFIVRVAGNVADRVDLGSIEYAAEHLGVPAVVVLGHHRCGAVKATVETLEGAHGAGGNIAAIVDEILPAVKDARQHPGKEGLLDDSAHAHTKRTAAALVERSPVLRKLVADKKLKIVAAMYDLGSGTIEWL